MKSNEMLNCELTADGVLHVTAYRHGTDKVSADRFVFNHERKQNGFPLSGRFEFDNEDMLSKVVRDEILPLLVKNFHVAFPDGLATKIVIGICPMTINNEIPDARKFQETRL